MFTNYGYESGPGWEAYETKYTGIEVFKDHHGIWLTIPIWDVEEFLGDHVPDDKEIDRFKEKYV